MPPVACNSFLKKLMRKRAIFFLSDAAMTSESSSLQPDTASALDICNAALCKIGEAPLDALIANHSTASRLCVLHYHPARRETLCMARWTFATTHITLNNSYATAPGSVTPFHFTLPTDCLRVLDVECAEWKMRGRHILASCTPLALSYIADVEDAELFDPLFMEALATRLAEKLAMPLTGNRSLKQDLQREFHQTILPQAATVNAIQHYSNDTHPLLDLLRKMRRSSRGQDCE